MKKCINCGVELEDNALFCGECGTKQPDEAKTCSNCGAELFETAKFCSQCGTPVSTGVAASTPAVVQPVNTNSDVAVSQPDGDTIAITIKGISFNLKLVEGREYGTHGEMLDFYMGETPVTQALWMAVMDENPSENNENLQYPVTNLTDQLITSFFIRLHKLTGVKFELPNIGQWLYAYKGGNKSKGYKYAGSNNITEVGWTDDKLHPVGELYPNELGLYDIEGNVGEQPKDNQWKAPRVSDKPDEITPNNLDGIRFVVNIPVDATIEPNTPLQTIMANQQTKLIAARETASNEFENNPEKKSRIEALQRTRYRVWGFKDGLAKVEYGGKQGYINPDGSWAIKPRFKYAWSFSEGVAMAVRNATLGCWEYGYIKPDGSWAIKPRFKSAWSFSEGVASVRLDKKWGYIKPDGSWAVKPQFKSAGSFSEGVAVVKLDEKWGYINPDGSWEIKPRFDGAGSFSEGVAVVELDEKRGYIKPNGSWAIKPQFDDAGSFSEGVAVVKLNGKKGCVMSNGDWLIEPKFDDMSFYHEEGFFRVVLNGKESFIYRQDVEDEVISKRKAEEAEKARIKAEEEAKRKAEEAEKARIKAEEDAKRKAEEAEKARIKAEEEAKRKAEEAARRKAEKEARIAELQRGIAPLQNKVAEAAPGLEHAKTLLNEKEQMVLTLESTIQESEQKIAASEKDIAAFNRRFSVILMRRVDNGLFNSKGTNFDNMLIGLTGAAKEQIKNWNQELKRSHRAVIGEQLTQTDALGWKRAIEQAGGQAIVENPYDDSEAERKMNSYTSVLDSANSAMQSAKDALPTAREDVERVNADYQNLLDSYNKVYLDMKSREIEIAYLQSNMSLTDFMKEADADESNRGALAVAFGSKYEEFKRAEEEARRKEEEQRRQKEEEARRRAEVERRKAEEEERKRLRKEMFAKVKGVTHYSVGDDIEKAYFAVYEKDYTAVGNSNRSLSDEVNNAIQSGSLHWEEYLTDYYWNKSVLKYAVVNKNTIVVKGRGRIPDVEPKGKNSRGGENKWHIVKEVDDIKEGIKNLVIIGEITHIGTRCFKKFEKLEHVVIPDCVETIGSSAFAYCTSLKFVVLPEKLKTIESEAFQFSGLQHIKFPKTTKKIAERAFSGCKKLESVLVPKTTLVESNVFKGCEKLE